MAYLPNPLFSMAEQQDKRLKQMRITTIVLAILLFAACATIYCLAVRLTQTNKDLAVLLSDTQQLQKDMAAAEQKLTQTRQKLQDTETEFEKSFNTLYPAFVAVEDIRYIGAGSQTYHYFSCALFSTYDTYTAHNSEYCDVLGYQPCPVCCAD